MWGLVTPWGSRSPRGAGCRAGCSGWKMGGRLMIVSKYQTIVITTKFSFESLSLDITAEIKIFAG